MESNLKAALDAVLRSYGESKVANQPGKVLSKGASGVNRWRNEPHDLLHHPHHNPPELLRESDLRSLRSGPGSANNVQVVSHDLMTHHLKYPYGRDPQESKKEAANELGAYTVLGSLGFHVPHISIVRDTKGTIGSLSRHIGEGGMTARHPFDMPEAEGDLWEHTGQYLPHPSDTVYQAMAPVLGLDYDRHDGNVLRDEHGRRWDLDFGTGDSAQWIQGGLDQQRHHALIHGLKTFLAESERYPGGKDAAMATIGQLAHHDTEAHFDWLMHADKKPFRAVDAPDPHGSIIRSLRTIRPDLRRL